MLNIFQKIIDKVSKLSVSCANIALPLSDVFTLFAFLYLYQLSSQHIMKPDLLRSFWLRTAECCERYLLRPVPPTPFRVGMIVEVNYKVQGKVIKLNPNGTYDIRYPEGRVDRHVSETDLRDVKGDVSNLRIRSEETAESGKHKQRIKQILKLAKGTEGVHAHRITLDISIHNRLKFVVLAQRNNALVNALAHATRVVTPNITP